MVGYTNEREGLHDEVRALLDGKFREKPIAGLTDVTENEGMIAVTAMAALNVPSVRRRNWSRRKRVDMEAVLNAAADVEYLIETGRRRSYGGSK